METGAQDAQGSLHRYRPALWLFWWADEESKDASDLKDQTHYAKKLPLKKC
jgi:hypothetical protein